MGPFMCYLIIIVFNNNMLEHVEDNIIIELY